MPTFAAIGVLGCLWLLTGFCIPSGGYGSKRDLIYAIIGFVISLAFLISLLFTSPTEFMR